MEYLDEWFVANLSRPGLFNQGQCKPFTQDGNVAGLDAMTVTLLRKN